MIPGMPVPFMHVPKFRTNIRRFSFHNQGPLFSNSLSPDIGIIEKMSCNKASGDDSISVRVLKKIPLVFANALCKLLNLSISTNSFSNSWEGCKGHDIEERRSTQ